MKKAESFKKLFMLLDLWSGLATADSINSFTTSISSFTSSTFLRATFQASKTLNIFLLLSLLEPLIFSDDILTLIFSPLVLLQILRADPR